MTKAQCAVQMGFDDRKAQRHLERIVELGLLKRVDAGRATTYEVM